MATACEERASIWEERLHDWTESPGTWLCHSGLVDCAGTGGDPGRRRAVRRKPRLHEGPARVRAGGWRMLRRLAGVRPASQFRARPREGLFREHEPGPGGGLCHRLAVAHVDLLADGAADGHALPVP